MKIVINQITKTIDGNKILNQISFQMNSGNIYGLKGRNGAGKTMLMRAMSGLIRPDSGSVIIDGEILGKDISFPRSLGILLESPGFIDNYTGFKNLKTLTDLRKKVDKQEIAETLLRVGLDPYDKKIFKKYSLGMKQKLGIAAAIVESPDFIILDEPTNALDEKSIEDLKVLLKELKEEGKIIVISCHDTENLLNMADSVIELEDGKLKYNQNNVPGECGLNAK